MNAKIEGSLSKVPEVTLLFWIVKIAATTLGETGGDAVSMSMNLGYLAATGIFAVIFLFAGGAQIVAKRFHPFLILDDDYRHYDRRHHTRRLRRPLARHRLRRRRIATVRVADRIARRLVSHVGVGVAASLHRRLPRSLSASRGSHKSLT